MANRPDDVGSENTMRMRIIGGLLAIAALGGAQKGPDKAALEPYLRHLLLWSQGVEVTLSDPKPAAGGLFEVRVKGTLGGRSQEVTFYASADGKNVFRGEVYDTSKNPFQNIVDQLKIDDQPFLGTPGAPVTVVEFADFQCPYCKQESAIVRKQLVEAFPKDVAIYYMDYPLDPIHPWARGAAVMGRCMYDQSNSSFWAFHDWAFEHQAEITPENLKTKALEYAATDKSLDGAKLAACAVAPEPRAQVEKTSAIAEGLHLTATPTFFINGRIMTGTIPFEDLKKVIEYEIEWQAKLKKDAECCSVQLALPGMGGGGK